jgi:hypothetical protein
MEPGRRRNCNIPSGPLEGWNETTWIIKQRDPPARTEIKTLFKKIVSAVHETANSSYGQGNGAVVEDARDVWTLKTLLLGEMN